MAGNSTIYDVGVSYTVHDKASGGLKNIHDHAKHASEGMNDLKESIKLVAEAFLVEKAFEKGKELFIDLNSQVEQMQLRMSALIRTNMGLPFEEATEASNKLTESWEKMGDKMPAHEIMKFGSTITGGVLSAGGSIAQLQQLAARGAQVGNALGVGSEDMAQQVRQALMGRVRKGQPIGEVLLPELNKMGVSINDFAKMASKQRTDVLLAAFSDPAWDKAVDKMSHTWKGATDILKGSIEQIARNIGLPLFQAMSGEINKWNQWLQQNPAVIADFASKFTTALSTGFSYVKSVIGFLVDNKDTLIRIAELWAVGKVGVGIVGGIQSVVTGISTFGTSLSGVTVALGALYIALRAMADAVDQQQKKRVDNTAEFQSLKSELLIIGGKNRTDAGAALHRGIEMGAFDQTGAFNKTKFQTELEQQAAGSEDSLALKSVPAMVRSMEAMVAVFGPEEIRKRMHLPGDLPDVKTGKATGGTVQNIHIHRIEVPAADPDRFVHEMVKKFNKVAKNPSQADTAMRRG